MKKAKRIFALAGAVILIALYLLTFLFSLMDSDLAHGYLCIFRMHIYHPGRLLCLHSSLQTQP